MPVTVSLPLALPAKVRGSLNLNLNGRARESGDAARVPVDASAMINLLGLRVSESADSCQCGRNRRRSLPRSHGLT